LASFAVLCVFASTFLDDLNSRNINEYFTQRRQAAQSSPRKIMFATYLPEAAFYFLLLAMAERSGANQRQIILHAVLAGLTPLIPVPLLDDVVKGYFQRRLVRKLAAAHRRHLSDAEVEALADDKASGCLSGCLLTVLVLPLKAIFRKIFFFLEWKRAVDIVSHNYYHGFLIDHALARNYLTERRASDIRSAIDYVLGQLNTSLIERSVKGVFNQSQSVLRNAARLLRNSLRQLTRRSSQTEVARVIEAVQPEEEAEVAGLVGQLENSINQLPAEHFEKLRSQLEMILFPH
jgi:hypothetical protein